MSEPLAPVLADPLAFDAPELLEVLEGCEIDDFDQAGFGLIVFDLADTVIGYNTFESSRSGLGKDRVLGRDLFLTVAPCTNNYLVAERFRESEDLDEQLDYVFTFRVRTAPVRLRLLARAGSSRRYLAIRPR